MDEVREEEGLKSLPRQKRRYGPAWWHVHGPYSLALQKADSSGKLLRLQQLPGPGKDADASLKRAGKCVEAYRLTACHLQSKPGTHGHMAISPT